MRYGRDTVSGEEQIEQMEKMSRKKLSEGRLPIKFGNITFVIREEEIKFIETQETERI